MHYEPQNALDHRGWQSRNPTFESDKVGYAVQGIGPFIGFDNIA
jgi:hypothetical protein